MERLQDLLDREVEAGRIPGGVVLVAHGDDVEVAVAGWADVERRAPMRRDSLLGVLLARVVGRPLGALMVDTGFCFRADQRDRRTAFYRTREDGGLELRDAPDGQWATEPANPSGAGGLVSTVDDWLVFGRFLLGGGLAPDGRRLLSRAAVTEMTATDHTTARQREQSALFLDGQGWGYGGAVDRDRRNPWNRPGRYGWIGGTGTAGYVFPAQDVVCVLMTQVELGGPGENQVTGAVCRYAAEVADRAATP